MKRFILGAAPATAAWLVIGANWLHPWGNRWDQNLILVLGVVGTLISCVTLLWWAVRGIEARFNGRYDQLALRLAATPSAAVVDDRFTHVIRRLDTLNARITRLHHELIVAIDESTKKLCKKTGTVADSLGALSTKLQEALNRLEANGEGIGAVTENMATLEQTVADVGAVFIQQRPGVTPIGRGPSAS